MSSTITQSAPAPLTNRAALTAGVAVLAGVSIMLPSAHAEPLRPNGPRERCPHGTLALPGNALARAVDRAIKEAPALFRGSNLKGMRATSAFIGSGNARIKCGRTIGARTATVKLRFPAYAPSASLQQHTVLVARFARGYRVWYVLR
jgi:hypothetical protein